MPTQRLLTLAIFIILATLVSCGPQTTPTPLPTATAPAAATKAIVLGDISNDPSKKIARFQPLADYLGANLSAFGINAGEVKIAPDLETMAQWMKAGDVDLYFDSPYPALIVGEQSGGQPILRRWKDGVTEYHSVIFALKTSGFSTLADLKGRLVAFDSIYSTSGYMLPKAYLLDAGLKVAEKANTDAAVAADEVGYTFSGEDENTIQWVISGKVAAGVVDSETYRGLPEETRAAMTILVETEKVARGVVVIRGGVEPELLAAIKRLLVGLDETAEGPDILKTFEKTAQFDEFPQGAEAAQTRLRALYQQVQEK